MATPHDVDMATELPVSPVYFRLMFGGRALMLSMTRSAASTL